MLWLLQQIRENGYTITPEIRQKIDSILDAKELNPGDRIHHTKYGGGVIRRLSKGKKTAFVLLDGHAREKMVQVHMLVKI